MLVPRDQYLLVRSRRVRGIVKKHKRRSEMARFTMKMFLVVSRTYRTMVFPRFTMMEMIVYVLFHS